MNVKLEDISTEIHGLFLKTMNSVGVEGLSSEKCNYEIIEGQIPKNAQNYENYKVQMVLNRTPPPESYLGEIPWEIGLADLINLEKGCFLGQEPVSRMVYRGRLRKYLYFGEVSNTDSDILTSHDEEVGKIITRVTRNQITCAIFFLNSKLGTDDIVNHDNLPIKIIQKIGKYPNINR